MISKRFVILVVAMALAWAMVMGPNAIAQGAAHHQPPEQTPIPHGIYPKRPGMDVPLGAPIPFSSVTSNRNAEQATDIPMGTPGLAFRYVQTFGVTEEPFVETHDHFYLVEGVGTAGNDVWVGDMLGHRALKFDGEGNFIAQIGKGGVVDATGTSLARVTDIAEDGDGNVWVVDAEASHVVKYDPSGEKVGELGSAWNPGSGNDRFENPIGIALDDSGNIFISDSGYWGSDYGNNRVQIFDHDGNYLATIGGGTCGTGDMQLCWPRHIAVYGAQLYVADTDNHRVQIFDITDPGAPTYVATLGTTGTSGSDNTHFKHPQGVAVDASYVYVADTENHRVQVFNRNTLAYVATIGGTYGTGNDQFKYPTDVAIDALGNIYVADYGNKRVQQFDHDWAYQRTYGTTGVSYVTTDNRFYYPSNVAVGQDGSIYVAEGRGHRLVKLNAEGLPQWTVGEAGQPGSDNAHFGYLEDVAVGPDGRIYTVESWGDAPYMPGSNHRVQIFNPDGSYSGGFGGYGSSNNSFAAPTGIALDASGNLYVADSGNQRIQIYDDQLEYVATLGETGVAGTDNAHFSNPFDVAVDQDGYIYVADEGNDRIQVFDSNYQYVCTIGGDGTGEDFEHFNAWGPHHIAVDSQGRLYVVDSGNSRVQVFDNFANGNAYLTTLGGSVGPQPGRFSNAMGVAVGPDDSVYVSETSNNHRIQKFVPGVPGWEQVNLNGFGDPTNQLGTLAAFNGYLYAGTYAYRGYGAQIWRTSDGINWDPVMDNGFGGHYNIGIDHLVAFQGNLYAGVWSSTPDGGTEGGEIWRSSNGQDWEQVVQDGFGDPTNGEVFHLAEFNDELYAATWSYSDTHGTEIWRSPTGDSGTWERVVENGFGNSNNSVVLTMAAFNDYLYAGTLNSTDGCDIWRTEDGVTWEPVVTGMNGGQCVYVSALLPYKGYLYAGARFTNGSGVLYRCSATSGCDEVADWEMVISDGFGNPNNYAIHALSVFNGGLYAITGNRNTGSEVWRSFDGLNWEKVGSEGFGDPINSYTYFGHGVAAFDTHLYIGTINWGNGGEIWRDDLSTFTDVPRDHWAWSYIERLYAAGITGGCATDPLLYCPGGNVTRAQMAVFLERGIHGSDYQPPEVEHSSFGDVSDTFWAKNWIEALYNDGVTSGCGNGNFCPGGNVTRAQMAVFLLRAEHGADYTPPQVEHSRFNDVLDDFWAKDWIEQLAEEGITSGCGGGNYCPGSSVTRAQMAVFLVRAFTLP